MNQPLKVLDVCAGLGGFSLGLEDTGYFETVGFVEIDRFCQTVLGCDWPDVPIYGDIHNVSASTFSGQRIDAITAGFPCQPFSQAGARQGSDDPRFLWPEIYRLVSEIRPQYIILENVPGIRSIEYGSVFGQVLWNLASCGYDAEWIDLRASDFGASQIRERWFLVAYAHEFGRTEQRTVFQSYPDQERYLSSYQQAWAAEFHARVPSRQAVADAAAQRRPRSSSSAFKAKFTQPARPSKVLAHTQKGRRSGVGAKSAQLRTAQYSNFAASPSASYQPRKRPDQSRMGRNVHGVSSRMDKHLFPAPQGDYQYPWEPSRTAPSSPGWQQRVSALGNAIIPQKATWIGYLIAAHAGLTKQKAA